jgi:3-hydroxybutyryl-CoA dehydrogenase
MPFILEKSTVVGGGLMGSQIALVLALGSKEVVLNSRRQETLDKAQASLERYVQDLARHDGLSGQSAETVLGRIRMSTSLEDAAGNSEFIVETITEDLEAKQALFKQLDDQMPPEIPLVSNTSGLPITQLGSLSKGKHRIAGSHFVQPAHIVPVMEVIKTEHTSEEMMDRTVTIWEGLGRTPLRVNQDIPGFLINRLQHAVIREAVALLASGIAGAEDIDQAFRLGLAPRFTTAGPLEQRDINGLSMHVKVATHLWKNLSSWEEPLAYLQELVARGNTGLESGKGYYDWKGRDAADIRGEKDEQLLRRTRQVMEDWNNEQRSR